MNRPPLDIPLDDLPECMRPYKRVIDKYGHSGTELDLGHYVDECTADEYYELSWFAQEFEPFYPIVWQWRQDVGGIVDSQAAKAVYYAASLAIVADDDRIDRKKNGLPPR